MTKMEIATYVGMANIMFSSVAKEDNGADEMIRKIQEALCAAQLILTNEAIEEYKEIHRDMVKEEQND